MHYGGTRTHGVVLARLRSRALRLASPWRGIIPQADTASNAVVAPAPVAPWMAPAPAPVEYRHALTAIAAQEWPAVRDSADPQRLERFERGFPGTFYADEARALREEIEADARRQRDAEMKRQAEAQRQHDAEAKRQAEEQRFRAEGRIPVQVGDRDHNKTQWILPGAGEWFCDLGGGPEMVVVPAGSFTMGSPETEPERRENESPLHKVTIARPFAVGRHAV